MEPFLSSRSSQKERNREKERKREKERERGRERPSYFVRLNLNLFQTQNGLNVFSPSLLIYFAELLNTLMYACH